MYSSIFADECYKFSSDSDGSFTILDFGANIGMSLLYFYEAYPNATITGFEADPNIYRYLESNVAGFCRDDGRLRVLNRAIWTEETELCFAPDGRVAEWAPSAVSVKAVDVRNIMARYEHIDFLKIDIEGSERTIIPAIKDSLCKVDKLFLEYHSEAGKPQCLREITDILADAGFRLYVHEGYCGPRPYIEKEELAGYDMMLEISAVKEH